MPIFCFQDVTGLRGEVLVAGDYRGGFCEISRLIKPVPAGSKRDPLLARAKPISDGGSASVVTDLRRGRKNCGETAVKREE